MRELRKAVAAMAATRVRTNPVKALRDWRQRAQQQALGAVVAKSKAVVK